MKRNRKLSDKGKRRSRKSHEVISKKAMYHVFKYCTLQNRGNWKDYPKIQKLQSFTK
jgi:hypothetical protein